MGLRHATFLETVPIFKPGDPKPDGYVDRHEWAQVQLRAGYKQVRCHGCRLWYFPQEAKEHQGCKPPQGDFARARLTYHGQRRQ